MSYKLRIILEYFQPEIGRRIRIFSLGQKNNILIKKKKKKECKTSLNLAAGLVWVEATRGLTTAINPMDKDAKKQNLSGVAPRYASNTLELYLLSSGASLILSSHLSSENMHVIPVLVILFTFGRLTFALGYKYCHAHRAFGHMITAFPTVYFMCIVYTASPGITSIKQ